MDLIIGGASNYTWKDLAPWVNSIKRSGFAGDIALVASNISKETIDKLTAEGVIVACYGQQQPDGSFKSPQNSVPHVERFFYMWNFLDRCDVNYTNVIVTDTRDVVFQSNPSPVLDELEVTGRSYIFSSEGLKYKDEPWGNNNLLEAFGPFFHNRYKDIEIFNVGVLAGWTEEIKSLLFMIFQLSINRPIPIVDQAVFNVLLEQEFFQNESTWMTGNDPWAAQLGTTEAAIRSGSGDIGISYFADLDQSVIEEYRANYLYKQPIIDHDGTVMTSDEVPYIIVHQYDRITGLKEKILEKYGDN